MTRSLPQLRNYIPVFHSPSFPLASCLEEIEGLVSQVVQSPLETRGAEYGILIVDAELMAISSDLDAWTNPYDAQLILICEDGIADGEHLVPKGWPKRFTLKALESALAEWTLRLSRHAMRKDLNAEYEKTAQLTGIAQALSAETNLDRLLTKILKEGRNLACCDAASMYLIEEGDGPDPELVFKLTQNDSISFPFEEKRSPLNTSSISGFVASTGKILNIPDVYFLDDNEPYVFNRSFDESLNYRTRSTITIPMKNHRGHIIGVLQFINRKTSPDIKLSNKEITELQTLPFTDELAEVLLALSSQAAIAIENATLIAQIQNLFEGFVEASVTAIEQRDPTTSGHSFRVANLTTSLALALPRSSVSRFKDLSFDQTQIREIRYASLLHDFGKVGVREHVLVKAEKLPERGLDLIRLRFAVFKEQMARAIDKERLDYILAHGRDAYRTRAHLFDDRLQQEWQRFSTFFDEIAAANKPTILPEGRFNHLEQIRDQPVFKVDDLEECLLTQDEFLALSVKKGSLTAAERLEIESHVRHTFDFLKRIPWTPDLRNTPEIAYAHHEKLDGTGYPLGLAADQIPLPSKAMTVADIYDALTASDRPYKPAMPQERALSILEAEAKRGQLDGDLVKVFIEAGIYNFTEDPPESVGDYTGFNADFIKRNVCDVDLPA